MQWATTNDVHERGVARLNVQKISRFLSLLERARLTKQNTVEIVLQISWSQIWINLEGSLSQKHIKTDRVASYSYKIWFPVWEDSYCPFSKERTRRQNNKRIGMSFIAGLIISSMELKKWTRAEFRNLKSYQWIQSLLLHAAARYTDR